MKKIFCSLEINHLLCDYGALTVEVNFGTADQQFETYLLKNYAELVVVKVNDKKRPWIVPENQLSPFLNSNLL